MNISVILIVAFLLLLVLFLLNIFLTLRIKRLEAKFVDISYNDLRILVDELKDLIIESERVAEHIDDNIEKKESVLEDLSALVESKLNRLENIIQKNSDEISIKEKILTLNKEGNSSTDIAKKVGVPLAEVNLILKLHK
jgi:predicted type IV restriction endonuclease